MNTALPHLVQYQGSKRKLASQILQYMPDKFTRLIEPFAGTAAITIAVAAEKRAHSYYLNDVNAPLIGVLEECIENPDRLAQAYRKIWSQQLAYGNRHTEHFYLIREQFNQGNTEPAYMLYLLARCVKGSVRYGRNGNFNQSPDKRRHGTSPDTLERNIYRISELLKGITVFSALDYQEVLAQAKIGDLVYMDPPYQGVTNTRDKRYCAGVDFHEFVQAIETLNQKHIDYIISYDGTCGDKTYGEALPEQLGCTKIMLGAGLSSQAILLGKQETTEESLYISPTLTACIAKRQSIRPIWEPAV